MLFRRALLNASRPLVARQPVVLPRVARSVSVWTKVPAGPPDPILGVTEAFKADTDPRKINLGVGAYRTDEGNPFVLPSVIEAEKLIKDDSQKEYLPITGLASFTDRAAELAYGKDSPVLKDNRLAYAQAISGTGALRLAAQFLSRFYNAKQVYVPTPTWGNHIPIFKDSGLEVKPYAYYNASNVSLDIEKMLKDIEEAPEGSIILLHACAHNPTGIDPTVEQWNKIADVVERRNHFALFDMAYQGFASGDLDKDAYAPRYFVERNIPVGLCQSFAKNMGLYGERVGLVSFVTDSQEEKDRVLSQLKILIRAMYSNPPIHGALVASNVLNSEKLFNQWLTDVKSMADRIINARQLLRNYLTDTLNNPKNWDHITSQIGMFCFSGLTKEQVDKLMKEHHVYLTSNGRISMAGVNSHNVEHLARSIDAVTRDSA